MLWHALTTYDYCERSVRNRLHEAGYDAVTPVEMIERIGPGKRRHLVPSVLLPEYCLIGSARGFDWPAIRHTRGVRGIMTMGGRPSVITSLAVEAFLAVPAELEAHRLRAGETFARIHKAGDRVRLLSGPFAGHVTEVKEARASALRVILQILGSSREVEIAMDAVEAA